MVGREEEEMKKRNTNITIPWPVYDKLIKHGRVGNIAFELYCFYQYTAIWQHEKFGTNNRPNAKNAYCIKSLKVRRQDFLKAKKLLVNLKLIKNRVTRD